MTLGMQILWGSCFLALCLTLHVACLALCTHVLSAASRRIRALKPSFQVVAILLLTLVILVFALTLEVWVWSLVWMVYDVLPDWNSAVYFSLVTFTALGYGDIVLGPEARVFATFGAVTGLLSFGLSTAFLVAMTTRLFAGLWDHQSNGEKSRANGAP